MTFLFSGTLVPGRDLQVRQQGPKSRTVHAVRAHTDMFCVCSAALGSNELCEIRYFEFVFVHPRRDRGISRGSMQMGWSSALNWDGTSTVYDDHLSLPHT